MRTSIVWTVLAFVTLSWALQAGPAVMPTVTGINPTSGPDTGGTAVTITGTNFTASSTVTIGGTAAASVAFVDAQTLTANTPAHAAGAADVVVSNGNQSGTLAAGFTYVASGGGGPPTAFRFLNTALPDGSTNLVYDATLLTANAAGPVTFSITAGRLPTGLTLSASTGLITNRPTVVEDVAVTFSATDGVSTITFSTSIKISAKGGGGNAGIGFPAGFAFADGRVGVAYSAPVTVEFGVGPFLFGISDLPAGLSLTGLQDQDRNATLSGIPTAAGTFYMTLSATDIGEGNNKVIVIVPLTILPAGSDFRFTTQVLNNGQIGTAFSQTIATNATGATFGATGLPPGLTIDPATGVISGTPTSAGTFLVGLSASNGTDTISMNRQMLVAPSATSSFHWVFSGGLPLAVMNVPYDRTNPPLVLVTENPGPGGGATYSAVGLPSGITYDTGSGQFSGTPIEPGIYPVTFTATNSAANPAETIILNYDFIVLPPNGGDVNNLPINLWVKKLQLKKTGDPGKDAWQVQYIYNADRRKDKKFNKNSDVLSFALGSIPEIAIIPPTTKLDGDSPKFGFKSAKGAVPSVAIKMDESSQTLALAAGGLTITDVLPGALRNTVKRGSKGYRLDLFIDAKGKFTATSGYRKTAFVVASAKVTAKAAGKDSAAFSMLLGDPAFEFPSTTTQSKMARFRVFNSAGTLVLDRDFSAIVTATTATDSMTGVKVYKLKTGKDTATPQVKFAYDSKSGKCAIAFKGATLTGLLAATEDHVSVELTLGDKQYFTGVTLFAPKAGSYSTKMP